MEESRLPCDVTNGEKEKNKNCQTWLYMDVENMKYTRKWKKGKIVCDDICPVFIAVAAQLDTLSA
jgi:hypothetical protein